MVNINFENIRPLDKSQNEAFEEFVCQLARNESIKNKMDFCRLGKPDGGVECFVTLKNGNEIGWQAKYFTTTLNEDKLKQIDGSIKTILSTHPKLTEYIIAIPINPSDAGKNRITMLMRWKTRVKKWERAAKNKGLNVKFKVWWKSDLIDRLRKPENLGLIRFWFNKDEFTDEWFKEKLNIAISDIGKRYTPELNFQLDIAKVFNGIARDNHYVSEFEGKLDDFLIEVNKWLGYANCDVITNLVNYFNEQIIEIKKTYDSINFGEMRDIHFDELIQYCKKIRSCLHDMQKEISQKLLKQRKLQESLKSNLEQYKINDDEIRKLENTASFLYKINEPLGDFENFVSGNSSLLCNHPVMILKGEWGKGKSHLVADVASKRMKEGKNSILLLGQQFLTREDPWVQILNKFQFRYSSDEFLGAINSKAQISNSRIIFFIDAINEGEGRIIWKEYINGFIKSFEKYPWLGLVVTIRNSYVKLLLNEDDIDDKRVVRIEHFGFQGVEYEAVKLFFTAYKIEMPSVPILTPEFSTPLFLKIFCDGLSKLGYTKIPDGLAGISSILDLYIKSINKSLSERLNYPNNINLVYEAAVLLVEKRLKEAAKSINYKVAFDLLEPLLSKYSNSRRFLDELIIEGFLALNLFQIKESKYEEEVYFTYERLENHLTARYLIKNFINPDKPLLSFKKRGKLHYIIANENNAYFNQGLIESLSILLPELINIEFYEVSPSSRGYSSVVQAFVTSLLWRKNETISEHLLNYINEYVIKIENDYLFETLLTISSIPDNYFNADFFHKHLMKFSLTNRDAWWLVYIHNKYPSEQSAVKTLIDWGWNENDKSCYSDESIRLTSKMIAWFLTSSNRVLRDGATKSLICLLENRISVLITLLKEFEKVNDPYVLERLYCVAYGCALRTRQYDKLKDLSEYIYNVIFNKEYVYPHILLRDYARGVIEFTRFNNIKIEIEFDKIKPPYKSKMPKRLPSNKQIEKYELAHDSKDFKKHHWSQNSILYSMATERGGKYMYGDFGRYVFQAGFRPWRKKLDPQLLSNWAVKKIFTTIGYDVEKHGYFDRNIKNYNVSRHYVNEERIGKKYQWLMFYELLARVADNFPMYDESSYKNEKQIEYDGPWNPYVRDIDPSMILKRTGEQEYDEIKSNNWWLKENYFKTDYYTDVNKWIYSYKDLPKPKNIIEVVDKNDSDWVVLETFPEWNEPKTLGVDMWKLPSKRIWYQLRSYFIEENSFPSFVSWALRQNFMGRWMPESSSRYEVFSREYYWSNAYKFFLNDYYSGEIWNIIKSEEDKMMFKIMTTSNHFLWEEVYDLSKEDTISFKKPSIYLYEKMEMKNSYKEGEFVDKENQLVCFDPSVNNESLSCLLVRKSNLMSFLHKNKLKIVWTVIGEKLIMSDLNATSRFDRRLIISGFYYYNKKNILTGKLKTHRE